MATSGYVDTNVAPIEGASSIYPKAVRTSWNASFDEATLLWTITWVSTALGNPSYPSQWTTYHGGTTSFTSSYAMNPAAPSGTAPHIEKTRHNQELTKGSFTIAIDDNGNSSFTINMDYYVNSTMSSGHCTATQSFSLDNKPQASTVSSSSSLSISQTSGTLSCTITSKKANYHRLYYGLAENTASEITLANNGYTASTLTTSITYSQILSKFSSAASGTLYFYVKTYKDSGRTQQTGGTRNFPVSVTISANASGIGPTISLGAISVNSSGVNERLVAGYSKAQSVATVNAYSGASIGRIDYSITYSNGSATTTGSNNASSRTIVSPVLPASTSNYTVTINATVYDTRGGKATASAVTATAFGYAVPNITATIYRTSESSGSNPQRDDAGNYVYVSYSASIYSVDGQNSIQSIGCTRTGASGNITSGSYIQFADNDKDTFTVTARDRVASSSVVVNIYGVKFPLEIFDNKLGQNDSVLIKTGGNIRVIKEVNPAIEFKPDSWDGNSIGALVAQTSATNNVRHLARMAFIQNSYNSTTGKSISTYERYYMPYVESDLSSVVDYNILTDKNPDSIRTLIDAALYSQSIQGRGTSIPSNSDLNDYIEYGKYYCGSNNMVSGMSNIPADLTTAFMLYVITANGAASGTGAWKYVNQILKPIFMDCVYYRAYSTDGSGSPLWRSWKKLVTNPVSLYSGTLTSGSVNVSNVTLYNNLVIGGSFTNNYALATVTVPVSRLSSTKTQYIISDDHEGNYCRFGLTLSGSTLSISIESISGSYARLSVVYGVN